MSRLGRLGSLGCSWGDVLQVGPHDLKSGGSRFAAGQGHISRKWTEEARDRVGGRRTPCFAGGGERRDMDGQEVPGDLLDSSVNRDCLAPRRSARIVPDCSTQDCLLLMSITAGVALT